MLTFQEPITFYAYYVCHVTKGQEDSVVGRNVQIWLPLFIVSDAVLSTVFPRLDERMQEEGKTNVSRRSFDMPQITYVFM